MRHVACTRKVVTLRERKVINVERWPNAQSSLSDGSGELSERKKIFRRKNGIYSVASFRQVNFYNLWNQLLLHNHESKYDDNWKKGTLRAIDESR